MRSLIRPFASCIHKVVKNESRARPRPKVYLYLNMLICQHGLKTLCPLGKCSCFSSCRLLIFLEILSGVPTVSNSLDLDQARRFVRPDLGTNCLQKLSADDTKR